MLDEPDMGHVVARVKKWGPEHAGTIFEDLKIRPCTYEELGLGPKETHEQAKFWPPHKSSRGWMDYYWKKFYCYDEVVPIKGDYDGSDVSHLQISFVKCNPEERSTCNSDEVIEQWLKRTFIIFIHNQIRFN